MTEVTHSPSSTSQAQQSTIQCLGKVLLQQAQTIRHKPLQGYVVLVENELYVGESVVPDKKFKPEP